MQDTSGRSLIISSFPEKEHFCWIFGTILPALEEVKGSKYLYYRDTNSILPAPTNAEGGDRHAVELGVQTVPIPFQNEMAVSLQKIENAFCAMYNCTQTFRNVGVCKIRHTKKS